MEDRQLIFPSKTGTISQTRARGAAKFAKTVNKKSSGRATKRLSSSRTYTSKHSTYFGLPLPATAEPKGWKASKTKPSRLVTGQSRKKTSKHSRKRSTRSKPVRRARKAG